MGGKRPGASKKLKKEREGATEIASRRKTFNTVATGTVNMRPTKS